MASSYICSNFRDSFCYICATYIKSDKIKESKFRTQTNLDNFCELYNSSPPIFYPYRPTSICSSCRLNMEDKLAGKKVDLKFSSPAIWKKPKKGHSNCYMCYVINQIKKNLNFAKYPHNIPSPEESSMVPPVQFDQINNINHSINNELDSEDEDDLNDFDSITYQDNPSDSDFVPDEIKNEIIKQSKMSSLKLNQENVSDLIRILDLSQERSEVLCSYLKRLKVTDLNVRICFYRSRFHEIKDYFKSMQIKTGQTSYLENIKG